MDMDASHNWLAFSLSHHPYFLDAFSSSPHHDEVAEAAATANVGEAKLEDFLGGCGEPMGRLSAGEGTETTSVSGTEAVSGIYDPSHDLKTITAGFLSGLPTADHPDADTAKALPAAALITTAADSRKAVDNFSHRTSIYRGVTRHRWTGRYEAHLWDNSCRREGQSRKGRQVYLGGYDKEEKAARAYDLAALKYWGPATTTNFPVSNYEKELEEMKHMTRQEFVASLRRKSSGFSRGASIYRGVTRHHQHGRWQARIGRVAGNKDLYLGTFSTQEEAAEAYDIAAIKFRGLNAVTNFDMSRYDVKSIANSTLPIGGVSARASKAAESSSSSSSADAASVEAKQRATALPLKQVEDYWSLLALHHHQQQQQSCDQASSFGFSSGVTMDFTAASSTGSTVLGQSSGGSLVESWSCSSRRHRAPAAPLSPLPPPLPLVGAMGSPAVWGAG